MEFWGLNHLETDHLKIQHTIMMFIETQSLSRYRILVGVES